MSTAPIFECLQCSQVFPNKQEALKCCGKDNVLYVCVRCDDPHDTEEEAFSCCENQKIKRLELYYED